MCIFIRGRYYYFYNILICVFLSRYSTLTTGLLYTINVLVIKVVAYLLISSQLIISFRLLILYLSLAQSCIDYNKLYIGQLPLSTTQPFIRDVLSKYTEVRDVRIVKGDARGTFDRSCYAFVIIKGNEEICNQVIKKANQQCPDWKLNIKFDNDRLKYMQHQQQLNPRQNMQMNPYNQGQQPQRMSYQPKEHQQKFYQRPNYQQNQPMHQQSQAPTQNFIPPQQQSLYNSHSHSHSQYQNPSNEPEKIVGQKHHRILVRQIWLGGIPQLCDKQYMYQLMSEFGMVQNLQIFPKFAFIKFRMVDQATLAFERAQRIYMMFGNPPGFRIFFSDPSRRANIVGNHYQYDRQSPFLPILFLGFPPVTSATIDMENVKSICEKYGTIINSYMRKNSNNQTRSYFLFTFDNFKSALRAKAQLNKRRDLLGDKRVEVTLLLDEEIVLRGRDLTHTQRSFQTQGNPTEKKKQVSDKPYGGSTYQNYPVKQVPSIPNVPNMPYTGMYHQVPPRIQYPGYMLPQAGQTPHNYPSTDMYYLPNQYFDQSGVKQPENGHPTNIHELLQSVFDKPMTQRLPQNANMEKKPIKTSSNNDNNISDIVSKMLGQQKQIQHSQRQKQRQISCSGFLTWKGVKRVAVDGNTEQKQLQEYVINITNLIEPKDVIRKENSSMILVPESSLHEPLFRQYVKALRERVGVSITPHFLMYVLSKSKQSDHIRQIHDNQLLVVMEKPSLVSLIRDKLQKCEQLK